MAAANTLVNILLQNQKTLSYVKDFSAWTMERDQARVFETGLEALFFCFNGRIKNMQILGQFVDSRINFTIPVTDLRVAVPQAERQTTKDLKPNSESLCRAS